MEYIDFLVHFIVGNSPKKKKKTPKTQKLGLEGKYQLGHQSVHTWANGIGHMDLRYGLWTLLPNKEF